MGNLYKGKINRLIIFAAPSGSGKTSFLKEPKARLSLENVPSPIADFHKLAPKNINIMGLIMAWRPMFTNLCLHVDLTQPIRWLAPSPSSRENLLAAIQPQMFSNWKELVSYSTRASEIHVITLFVRREEHFRRWTGRALNQDPKGGFNRVVTTVNGDNTNGSELHRKVYRSWQDFVEVLSPQSSHILDGNGSSYCFLSQSEYEIEIDTEYRR